jgi:mono/diheme cytochrome c family protein
VPLTADPHYIAVEAENALFPGSAVAKRASEPVEPERVSIFGPGQLLFYNRCAACHAIGKVTPLGPDLQGVTARRERDWLIRFIGAPNLMRAHKDPIALELASQYKVLMPRVELTKKELGDIVGYLEAQDRSRSKPAGTQAAMAAPRAEASAGEHDHQAHQHHSDK